MPYEYVKKSRATCSCGLKCLLAFEFFPYYLKVAIILFVYLYIYLFSIPLVQTDDEWNCRIRKTVVHLPVPKFGDGFYFPSCATLSRCSGCCFATNLDCVPVVQQVEMEFYHIIPHGVFFFNAVVKCFSAWMWIVTSFARLINCLVWPTIIYILLDVLVSV